LSGLALGHEAAERAADHAERETPTWKEQAFTDFVNYAKRHSHFTTEQVRAASESPPPPDPRAWGHVALRAKKEKVVVSGEWVRATSKTVHGMVVTQWQSLIFDV
jgi:hypothetical protein